MFRFKEQCKINMEAGYLNHKQRIEVPAMLISVDGEEEDWKDLRLFLVNKQCADRKSSLKYALIEGYTGARVGVFYRSAEECLTTDLSTVADRIGIMKDCIKRQTDRNGIANEIQ